MQTSLLKFKNTGRNNNFMEMHSNFFVFQNAGAVIGKGGKNIKALRTDVSIKLLNKHSLSVSRILKAHILEITECSYKPFVIINGRVEDFYSFKSSESGTYIIKSFHFMRRPFKLILFK